LSSSGFFLVSKDLDLKYLLGLLNSMLMKLIFNEIGVMTAGGAFTLKKSTIERFPIKIISKDSQLLFINKVNQILELKKEDSKTDTTVLEQEIDQMVYKLYGLTEEEITIVENC